MTHPISSATTVMTSSSSFCCNPLQWLIDKVNHVIRKIFGYIMRTSVFQLGEYHKPCAYSIMRGYQRFMSDPREEKPIDPVRLDDSRGYCLAIGGVETTLFPEDGNAVLRCMHFTSKRFFEQVDRLGGEKRKIILCDGERFAIVPKEDADPAMYKHLSFLLSKFFLPKICDAKDPSKIGFLLPVSEPLSQDIPPLVMEIRSPGRSLLMDRRSIIRHIAAGYDFISHDPRNTISSKGIPSEGGYYLDAKAVLKYALSLAYPLHNIHVIGYCEGGVPGASLMREFPEINLIIENPFDSLLKMAQHQTIFGRLFAEKALPEVQSTDLSITSRTEQNGFDLAEHFQTLPSKHGKITLIHTKGDPVVPPHSVHALREALGVGHDPKHYPEWYEEIERVPKSGENGHLTRPTQDLMIWEQYIRVLRPEPSKASPLQIADLPSLENNEEIQESEEESSPAEGLTQLLQKFREGSSLI